MKCSLCELRELCVRPNWFHAELAKFAEVRFHEMNFQSHWRSCKMHRMQGIRYVTDERGERVAVQIDLKKHRDIWEDFLDLLTAKRRQSEPRESLASVKARLRKTGKLNG